MTRAAEIGEFLAREGWGWAKREPLAGDASARRYERLRRGGRLAGAILMDMPPESGLDVRPFLAVTAWLRAGRFSAPEVLGADARRGLVLLEDLGDDLFAAALRPRGEARGRALRRRRRPPRRPAAPAAARQGRRLDPAALRHGRPAARGAAGRRMVPAGGDRRSRPRPTSRPSSTRWPRPPSPRSRRRGRWRCCATTTPRTCCGCRGGRGHARVGMLDYQDMLVGHPGYDLISLLEDARRDVSAGAARGDARALPRAQRRRSGGVRRGRACARRPAQPQDRRALHPALPPRRQAALPRLPAAGLGTISPATSATRRWPGSLPWSPGTCRRPRPEVVRRIEAAA